jgi:hypothetical protein
MATTFGGRGCSQGKSERLTCLERYEQLKIEGKKNRQKRIYVFKYASVAMLQRC